VKSTFAFFFFFFFCFFFFFVFFFFCFKRLAISSLMVRRPEPDARTASAEARCSRHTQAVVLRTEPSTHMRRVPPVTSVRISGSRLLSESTAARRRATGH